jgi:hypothetical protein
MFSGSWAGVGKDIGFLLLSLGVPVESILLIYDGLKTFSGFSLELSSAISSPLLNFLLFL